MKYLNAFSPEIQMSLFNAGFMEMDLLLFFGQIEGSMKLPPILALSNADVQCQGVSLKDSWNFPVGRADRAEPFLSFV